MIPRNLIKDRYSDRNNREAVDDKNGRKMALKFSFPSGHGEWRKSCGLKNVKNEGEEGVERFDVSGNK